MQDANVYLTFDGNCREAMQFYASCLGAELQLSRIGDEPGAASHVPKEAHDRIMHARLFKAPLTLMASDSMPGGAFHQGNNFSIALQCDNAQEADKLFAALGQNGKVTMPLQETFWAARFGMLTDRFGINWMFNVYKPQS